jgi:K(+)-stimulated pyrophosphate-energized sodium pump
MAALGLPLLLSPAAALAAEPEGAVAAHHGGEASLILPDLGQVNFLGMNGRSLLMLGLIVCGLGFVFGLTMLTQVKNLPVHASMREISELIYETCKTYLVTQGKFILLLEVFIGSSSSLLRSLQHCRRSRSSSSCSSA